MSLGRLLSKFVCCGVPASEEASSPHRPVPSPSFKHPAWSLPPLALGASGGMHAPSECCSADFHDARSRASHWSWSHPGSPTQSAIGEREPDAASPTRQDMPPPVSPVKELALPLPPWMPPQPLRFMDPSTRFRPVPTNMGLAGFWAKIPEQSTPNPLPIDKLINANFLAKKAHESITGIKVTETPEFVYIRIKLQVWGLPSLYSEAYKKDGSSYTNSLRRDIRPGKSLTHVYFTEAGDTVFVSDSYNMMGAVDFHGEEVVRVSDDGSMINFKMYCHSLVTGGSAEQYFMGRKQVAAATVSRRTSSWGHAS